MKMFILRMIKTVAKIITFDTDFTQWTQPSVLFDNMAAGGHSGFQQNKAPLPNLAISCYPMKLHNCLADDTVSFIQCVPGHTGQRTLYTAYCDYTRNVLILISYSTDGAQSEGCNETAV